MLVDVDTQCCCLYCRAERSPLNHWSAGQNWGTVGPVIGNGAHQSAGPDVALQPHYAHAARASPHHPGLPGRLRGPGQCTYGASLPPPPPNTFLCLDYIAYSGFVHYLCCNIKNKFRASVQEKVLLHKRLKLNV